MPRTASVSAYNTTLTVPNPCARDQTHPCARRRAQISLIGMSGAGRPVACTQRTRSHPIAFPLGYLRTAPTISTLHTCPSLSSRQRTTSNWMRDTSKCLTASRLSAHYDPWHRTSTNYGNFSDVPMTPVNDQRRTPGARFRRAAAVREWLQRRRRCGCGSNGSPGSASSRGRLTRDSLDPTTR